jgi:hypothetical protein
MAVSFHHLLYLSQETQAGLCHGVPLNTDHQLHVLLHLEVPNVVWGEGSMQLKNAQHETVQRIPFGRARRPDVPDFPLPHLWEVSISICFTVMSAQNHLGITALFFSCCYIIRATDPISFVNAYADAKD